MKDFFRTLRAEAERASEANVMLMADLKGRALDRVSDKVSGHALKSGLQSSGLLVSGGSVVGLMGLAVANQAAALGTSAMLASASTALAGLGTVAVGASVLPVATVATLGAAVAGLAVVAAAKFLPVDHARGAYVANAIRSGDHDRLRTLGRESPGLRDWLQGAKQMLFDGVAGRMLGNRAQEAKTIMRADARTEYELDDLFSSSPAEALRDQQALVEKIADEIWQETGASVDFDAVHSALGKTRDQATSVGKILAVDKERGLVVQSIGRGRATVHALEDFKAIPEVGEVMTLSYKAGVMHEPRSMAVGHEAGVSR